MQKRALIVHDERSNFEFLERARRGRSGTDKRE